jgi:hypothetical protein
MNLDSEGVQFSVLFFTPTGEPWVVTDSNGASFSQLNVTVGGLGMVVVELPSTGPEIETGWALLDLPDGATIGGQLIFRDNGGPDRPIPFEAVSPLTSFSEGSDNVNPSALTVFAPFDQSNGFNTCLAIANPMNIAVNVVLIYSVLGEGVLEDATETVTLAAGSQQSFCLRGREEGLEGRRGYVTIARGADTFLAVLGLRFDPQGAFTTLFPMSLL